MATSGSGYSLQIESLVSNNSEEQLNKLVFQWTMDIQDSNGMISEIEYNGYNVEEHISDISAMLDRLNKEIDYYVELGIDIEKYSSQYNFQEIRRNLDSNYRKLSLIYYKYNFDNFAKKTEDADTMLKKITSKQKAINSNMRSLHDKIENLGATFLNIVLTISITSTMITLLSKVKTRYALVIVLASSWLLLTCTIFVGSYFKKEKSSKESFKLTFPIIIYIILTVVTMITFSLVSYFDIKDFIEKHKADIKIEEKEIIDEVD